MTKFTTIQQLHCVTVEHHHLKAGYGKHRRPERLVANLQANVDQHKKNDKGV